MVSSLFERVDPQELEVVKMFTASFPVRVGELAEKLGIKVSRTPLEPKISGLICPYDGSPSGFEIKVNKYEIPERQRFTVAHELGHYLLHRRYIGTGVVDSTMYRSNLTSRKEYEANTVAADIVMPARLVSEQLARLQGNPTDDVVSELAALFRVSIPAMKVRLGVE